MPPTEISARKGAPSTADAAFPGGYASTLETALYDTLGYLFVCLFSLHVLASRALYL